MLPAKFEIVIPPQQIEENPDCLRKIAIGDEHAFSWLYKNYCKRLFDYVLVLCCDKELAEDIVHDVFLKLWTGRERLVFVQNFSSYLYTMAKNHFLNICQKQKRELLGKEELKSMVLVSTDDLIIKREDRRIMEEAIGDLSPRQRLVFRLVKEEGLSRNQISGALDISPFTVKATMQKAIKGIKEGVRERSK